MLFNLFADSSSANAAGAATGALFMIFMGIFWFVIIGLQITAFVMWILALLHVVQHEDIKDRTTWILVVALCGGIGGIIYYFVVKKPYDKGGMRDPHFKKQ